MQATRATAVTQMRKGIVEYCVLAHLWHGPTYGRKIAGALTRGQILESEGTLYPLLARLRKQRWVETSWQESPSGPPRRYYTLTNEGRVALDAFRGAWEPFTREVSKFMEGAQ